MDGSDRFKAGRNGKRACFPICDLRTACCVRAENEIHMSDQIMSDLRPAAGGKFCIFSSLKASENYVFMLFVCSEKKKNSACGG